MMKKIIIGVLVVGAFLGMCHWEHCYTRENCVVIAVDKDKVTVEDKCGFTWAFYGDNYEIGDVVDLKMHDNCSSAYIGDDEITKVVKAD